MLGALARYPIKLTFCDLELAFLKGYQSLDSAFTKGLLTNNDAAAVVLNSTCKDL